MLAGTPFPITFDSAAINATGRDMGGRTLYGFVDYFKQKFQLNPDQTPACLRDSLLHETIHLVFMFTGLSTDMSTSEEEEFVSRLSPVLLMVLRDNPEMVRYLLAEA